LPLLGLFEEGKSISAQVSTRIHHCTSYLSLFEYTLKFHRTTGHSSAHALSRLLLPVETAVVHTPPELVLLAENLDESPVTADQIHKSTRLDLELAPIVQFLQQGWPRVQSSTILIER